MSIITLFPRSRFQNTPQQVINGVETFGTWVPPSFLQPGAVDQGSISNFLVTNANEGRPDLIANTVYGDPFLDWVIIAWNKPRDVLNWPKAGTVITYPVISAIAPYLK